VVVAGMPRTATVLWVGIMCRALLEELRSTVLDQAGRERLRVVFDATLGELAGCLPEALAGELGRLVPALGVGVASQAELRLALAQLTGWLDGVLYDIPAGRRGPAGCHAAGACAGVPPWRAPGPAGAGFLTTIRSRPVTQACRGWRE
jgi:Bacterial proteasome activator